MKTCKKIWRLKLILLGFCISFCLFSDAQSFIDEDFLDKIETNARFMLEEPDPAFKDNQTPAKWNNESAVVIGYSRIFFLTSKAAAVL